MKAMFDLPPESTASLQTSGRRAVTFPANLHAIGPSLRILLAEEGGADRRHAEVVLARAGHRVVAVADGRHAVAAVRDSDFDIILLDVRMPILDGFAAARRIRRLPAPKRSVPIVALTGDFTNEDRALCRAAGMNDWTGKPVQRDELFRALERVLDTEDDAVQAPLDAGRLSDLGAVLPRDRIVDLLEMFVAGARFSLDGLRQYSAELDLAACGRVAHGLAGMAGNIGAREIARLARGIMAASRSRDLALICRHLAELDAAADSAAAAARAWIAADRSRRPADH